VVKEPLRRAMIKRFNKFLWTAPFLVLVGLFGCGSGLYFQRLGANGLGLWFLGLVFLGAAYLEREDAKSNGKR
jgi:hypothetical protein